MHHFLRKNVKLLSTSVGVSFLTTAQQAKPKVMGQIEPSRAQLITRSTVDKTYSSNVELD